MRKYAYVRSKGYQALPHMDIAHVVVLNLDLVCFESTLLDEFNQWIFYLSSTGFTVLLPLHFRHQRVQREPVWTAV